MRNITEGVKQSDTRMKLTESGVETLAGGFAGVCQVFVGHPFDTIKVSNFEICDKFLI